MLKQMLPDSTNFTEAIFKMPQISKHFLAMLSLDDLEKYRLFTEGNLKPFIHKEFE